jgi:hypothetical protein
LPAPGCAGSSVAVVTGASVSSPDGGAIVNVTDFGASMLPAASDERNSTVYAPGAVNRGLLAGSYGTQSTAAIVGAAKPLNGPDVLTWYSVRTTPEVASAPVSVSVTGPVPSSAAVVVGAVASILTVADFAVSALPAASVERYSTVCVPSPETLNGAL